jgi:hypothetical protein
VTHNNPGSIIRLASIKNLNADKKAIYLNNDHGTLENGALFIKESTVNVGN